MTERRGDTTINVSREQALAFRASSHNLSRRLPAGSLLQAAGACGIQNSPPGSAALSLHARVEDFVPEDLDRALETEKALLQTMSLRGAPYIFPTADAAVFTTGLLPEDEASIRAFIRGANQALDLIGISGTDLLRLTAEELSHVLDRRELNKDQLGIELAERLAKRLPPEQLPAWRSKSWYAQEQSLGESAVRFALYVVSLQGLFCYAPRHGNSATFLRTDQWLGEPLPQVEHEHAGTELVRRYLHCYGPSKPEHFAEWTGTSPEQTARTWKTVEGELAKVSFEGKEAWLLEQDIRSVTASPKQEGVRFLPPHDPYLQLRDRTALVPDKKAHRNIWKAVGSPGALLAEGEFAGTWRSQKKGKRLNLTVELSKPVSEKVRADSEAEAAMLGPLKGCTCVEVKFV